MTKRSKDKLYQLITFLVQQTQCSPAKLLKLVYLADKESCIQTGVTITSMNYFAWKNGSWCFYVDEVILI